MKTLIWFCAALSFTPTPLLCTAIGVLATDDDTSNSDLGRKTAELKKQALKILALRGENVDQTVNIKSNTNWDDIQMTEDLYQDIKTSFDEEEKLLASMDETERMHQRRKPRMTAPDFKLIPFAKWSMPIQYTMNTIKSPSLKTIVRNALHEIETKSGCIKFKEVTSAPNKPYIQFNEVSDLGEGICANSPIGRQDRVNDINIATDCNAPGKILHETLHSLGFAHTQQRPDVSQFITIKWSNILPDKIINFKPWKYALKDQGPFDYNSIMMFPHDAFSKNGEDTLVAVKESSKNRLLMGQRQHLSTEDVNILKKIYCKNDDLDLTRGPIKPPTTLHKIMPDLPCGQPKIEPMLSKFDIHKVMHGIEARPHSWPWQVSLQCCANGNVKHICGGTIIAPDKILTAAHCITFFTDKPTEYSVIAGAHYIPNKEKENAVIVQVAHFSTLDGFNYNKNEYLDDIIVLTLKQELTFNDHIMPVCLAQVQDVPFSLECYVTGWGVHKNENSDTLSNVLKQVDILVNKTTACEQHKVYSNKFNKTKMICTDHQVDGKDACHGDSGGPLVCLKNGVWTQYGIISFGQGCGSDNEPAVYTMMSFYSAWVQRIITSKIVGLE